MASKGNASLELFVRAKALEIRAQALALEVKAKEMPVLKC